MEIMISITDLLMRPKGTLLLCYPIVIVEVHF